MTKMFSSERMKSALWYFGVQLVYLAAWRVCGWESGGFLVFSGATTAAYMTLLGVKTVTDRAKIKETGNA